MVQVIRYVLIVRHARAVWRLLPGWVALSLTASLHAATVETDLRFETTGQPLFSTISDAYEPHTLQIHLLDKHIPPQTQGEIRNVPQGVPLATLQYIWQQAIDTCTGYTYPLPNPPGGTVSPSESECINGGNITRSGCYGEIVWGVCVGVSWSKTVNVGPGIGPKPTKGLTANRDIGAVLRYSGDIEAGIEGNFTLDKGSVDVLFNAHATLSTNVDKAQPGEVVTLDSGYVQEGEYSLKSRYPNLDFSLGSFLDARTKVTLEYAGVDYNDGSQIRKTTVIYDADSLNSDLYDASSGFVKFADMEYAGINVSPAGLELRILGESVPVLSGGLLATNISAPLAASPGAPQFPLADIGVYTPVLNSPVVGDFNCGDCFTPLRDFVDVDNTITNTVPFGKRNLFAGITDGTNFTWPVINDGVQDADFGRFDLDVDVISLVWGVPLGAEFKGPRLPSNWVTGPGSFIAGPIIAAEVNAIDFDTASFWGFDQKLKFDPQLYVELEFSVPTLVKGPQDADFTSVTSKLLRVGDALQYSQPDASLTITPHYTLRNNKFSNDTKLMVDVAFQITMDQIKLTGIIPSIASAWLPTNFAAMQITPELADPIPVWSSDPTGYALAGFTDIDAAPITITKSAATGGTTGSGTGDGTDTNGGAGGGALSTEVIFLLGYWLLIGAYRQWYPCRVSRLRA